MELKEQLDSALVIESQPLSQSHIRHTLNQLGFSHIDFADRARLAIQALETRSYDLLLCGYDLNQGADGYQLFEQLLDQGLISTATSVVFLSSEKDMQLSQSIIELKPDDFLLKPFSTQELEVRLTRILRKKLKLKDVFLALDSKQYKKAIARLNEHISENTQPKWIPYLMKLKGEIILSMANWPLAEQFFEKVCTLHPYPWAKFGLIESLFHQGKTGAAKAMLNGVLQSQQNKLPALDLMAQICQQDDEFEQAIDYLKSAIDIAPRNINRQKQVVDLARLTHDFELQHTVSTGIVRQVRYSIHDKPDAYLTAVRAAVDYGLTTLNKDEINQLANSSENMLQNLKKRFPGTPLNEQIQIAKARILNMQDQPDQAKRIIAENLDTKGIYYIDDLEDALDKAKAFHEMGFHADSQKLFEQIADACQQKKNSPLFSSYIEKEQKLRIDIKQSPKDLNNRAVSYFSRGNLRGAYDAFKAAFTLMPKNGSIALNLMQTIIEHQPQELHQDAVLEELRACHKILDKVELNEEQQLRLEKLHQILDERRVAL